jgi:hypothetical protein
MYPSQQRVSTLLVEREWESRWFMGVFALELLQTMTPSLDLPQARKLIYIWGQEFATIILAEEIIPLRYIYISESEKAYIDIERGTW